MRCIASETTTILNAMRGKLDNKKRWAVAVLIEEIPVDRSLNPGKSVTIGEYIGMIEEDDFVMDSGVITCFAS